MAQEAFYAVGVCLRLPLFCVGVAMWTPFAAVGLAWVLVLKPALGGMMLPWAYIRAAWHNEKAIYENYLKETFDLVGGVRNVTEPYDSMFKWLTKTK